MGMGPPATCLELTLQYTILLCCTSTADDLGKHGLNKLRKSFMDNNIDNRDQVAWISEVKPVDNHVASLAANECEVKVKVKKNLPKMVHCAKSICSAPPEEISLKSIQ